ncbi:MAG: ribonuclease P protein component [Arenicella sp.]|nr:ribonuclease P protein component [Arenicella sp.]
MLSFGKTQRLRTAGDFRRVYQARHFGTSEHHVFNIAANQKQLTRLGVTVSRKVSRLAVVRNRLRRQIKEFYRLHQHDLQDADLVISAKPSCATATVKQQTDSLQQLWTKVMKWQRWYRATHQSSTPVESPSMNGTSKT